jgi:hypothetical protein
LAVKKSRHQGSTSASANARTAKLANAPRNQECPSRFDNRRLRGSRRHHGLKDRLRPAFPSEEGHRKRNQTLIEKGSDPSRRKSLCHQRRQADLRRTNKYTNKNRLEGDLCVSRRRARSLKTARLRQLEKARWPIGQHNEENPFIIRAWRNLKRRTDQDGRKPDHHRQGQDDPKTFRGFALLHFFGFASANLVSRIGSACRAGSGSRDPGGAGGRGGRDGRAGSGMRDVIGYLPIRSAQ